MEHFSRPASGRGNHLTWATEQSQQNPPCVYNVLLSREAKTPMRTVLLSFQSILHRVERSSRPRLHMPHYLELACRTYWVLNAEVGGYMAWCIEEHGQGWQASQVSHHCSTGAGWSAHRTDWAGCGNDRCRQFQLLAQRSGVAPREDRRQDLGPHRLHSQCRGGLRPQSVQKTSQKGACNRH
jgi:hypothetical protein